MNYEETSITVDSAAEESVCPRDRADMYGLERVGETHQVKLINASGGEIRHYAKES